MASITYLGKTVEAMYLLRRTECSIRKDARTHGKPHTLHMRKLNSLSLRGMSHVETIYEGIWQDDENITAMLTGVMNEPGGQELARLSYGGKAIEFDVQSRHVTFGRDPASSVVVSSRKASRAHARIERRREKLILVDQSANGTYVTDEQGRKTVLRLEEMALRGRGYVSFGEPVATRGASLLEYMLDSTMSLAETSKQNRNGTE